MLDASSASASLRGLAPSASAALADRESQANASSRLLTDAQGRQIDHLRLSVTTKCDLRCTYCRPRGEKTGHDDSSLSDRQRVDLVAFMVRRYGLKKVRLTGGEPLLYPDLARLVTRIRDAAPQLEIAMTTNGRRLREQAEALRAAGVHRINISVDSINPRTYRRLTGADLDGVLTGLDAAISAGFLPPRINTVVLRGHNDHELVDLTTWALSKGLEIRFLEAMPIGPAARFNQEYYVSAEDVLTRIRTEFNLTEMPRGYGDTSRRFQADRHGLSGVMGLIAPVSQPFCAQCRRVRVTANGRLYPCLLDDRHVDLACAWSGDTLDHEMADRLIRAAVKPKAARGSLQTTSMITLGG